MQKPTTKSSDSSNLSALLSDEEVEKVMRAVVRGHNVERALTWARETRLQYGILENVLAGNVDIIVTPDGRVQVQLNNSGVREASKLQQGL